MSQIMQRAEELVTALSTGGVKVTDDIAKAGTITPGILVVPVPTLTPETFTAFAAEWEIVCLVQQPANKNATRKLHELVKHVVDSLPNEGISWTPDAYQITNQISLPAYIGSFTELIEL